MHPVVVLFDDASKRNCVRLPYVCARIGPAGVNQKMLKNRGESSVMYARAHVFLFVVERETLSAKAL